MSHRWYNRTMTNEAVIENFYGTIDVSDVHADSKFLQVARIVAGEAKYDHGAFTFVGYASREGETAVPVVTVKGHYQRADNIIRVFFDNPPNHSEEVPLTR